MNQVKLSPASIFLFSVALIFAVFSSAAFAQKGDTSPGRKLSLRYKCSNEPETPEKPFSAMASNGDLIYGVCDKVFRVNSSGKILWEYETGYVADMLYFPASNLIYITNGGSALTMINAASGREVDHYAPNGSAMFKTMKPYGTNGFLFVTSMEDYRGRTPDVADTLTFWRGTRSVWEIDIPANAEIVTSGNRILAISKNTDGVYVKELKIPVRSK